MTAQRTWTNKHPTAAGRREAQIQQALAHCEKGDHQTMPTFRPSEKVCLICGLVLYCPTCLLENNLPVAQAKRVYALTCPTHQSREVAGGHP
jgi:hypothetical protein